MTEDSAGHRERRKRLFLESGLIGFSDYEVLEMMLFYCISRQDTKPIAKKLLDHFGSFKEVINADIRELIKVDGVGKQTALFISLLKEFSHKYLVAENKALCKFEDMASVLNYCRTIFLGVKNEQAYLLLLDENLKLIKSVLVCEGTVNEITISSRKIADIIIKNNCNTVILTHNHPRSLANPSNSDISFTENILKSLNTLGIRLLDHIIVGNDTEISLKTNGYLFNLW